MANRVNIEIRFDAARFEAELMRRLALTSGTSTVFIGSYMKITRIS